ncbi:hypothetical protein BC332_24277 [Capsicum chinense]|nr:hypothetical protein BC332_24277 [Capsicum chinense]
MYYFIALGSCIWGFAHMIKVIAIDDTHLRGKHKSIANGIARAYNHDCHGYCMRHLGENVWVNYQCGYHLYLFYHIVKAYSFEEFSNYFEEFKNYCLEIASFLEHDLGFEKWSKTHSPDSRYDMIDINIVEAINCMLIVEKEYPMTSIFNSISKRFGYKFREKHAYVLNYKDDKFVPTAKKVIRDSICEGDSFYVVNLNGDDNQFTVFGRGPTAKVNLLEKLCSSRKFDLVKIPSTHAMATFLLKHDDDYGLSMYEYSSLVYKVCHFVVKITDASDTITATVSETVAETMLSLTGEQIYQSVAAQLQKPIYKFPDQTPGMLAVTSFSEAEKLVLQILSSPMAPGETGGTCPKLDTA